MNDFKNKIVEVCSECLTASCWHGKFMCSESKNAGTEFKTVSELRVLDLEHKDNWSDKSLNEIYGDPAPYGYKDTISMQNRNKGEIYCRGCTEIEMTGEPVFHLPPDCGS